MPMSEEFKNRLFPVLPEIIKCFETPFIILDEQGIIETVNGMKSAFDGCGFKQYFAVKACPVPSVLEVMNELDCGIDCSSIPELAMGRTVGFSGEEIMFSSNNTLPHEFNVASEKGGCILNLDDITMISKVPDFPELISFRYNPGERRKGNEIIGNPKEAKYGLRDDQVIRAYKYAMEEGVRRFGLHTMICSNEIDYRYMIETIKMLLEVTEKILKEIEIKLEFINIGGGIGIPKRPGDDHFNIQALGKEARILLNQFRQIYGFAPKLFTECGRYITGPHGALVSTVINRMSKYREYAGVDASMVDFMRPAIYGESAYHHISVLNRDGIVKEGPSTLIDVSGSLCENNDKFAVQRPLPTIINGDVIVLEDAGAHGRAMGSNYNGRLRCQELMLRTNGNVEMIRRRETVDDYLATFVFNKKTLSFRSEEV